MSGQIVIAPQTKVALMGYILILLAKILFIIQQPTGVKFAPFIMLYVVTAALGLYVLNCTVVGKCNLYAWIVSYIVSIVGMFFIVWLLYSFIRM